MPGYTDTMRQEATAMPHTDTERRNELARQVGSLTGTIKLAIAALETGSQPEVVARLLRKAIGQDGHATELYEALEGLLKADGRWRDYIADEPVDRAEAALRKARGETP